MRLKVSITALFVFLSFAITASAQIVYKNFKSTAGLNLIGSASVVNKRLQLTPPSGGLTAVWKKTKVPVQGGFWTSFNYSISNGFGADGFTFAIQNTSNSAIGGGGGGLGIEGVPNALVVEFDTFSNAGENGNHIAVLSNGPNPIIVSDETTSLLATAGNVQDLNDGVRRNVTIRYIPGKLTVAIEGFVIISVDVDLSTLLNLDNGEAYVGFTAATGGFTQEHDIYSWSFSSGSLENLAMDPAGHFILFNAPSTDGSCTSEVIWYQGLKSDGSASGDPIQLTSCATFGPDQGGLDLLQDGTNYFVSFNELSPAAAKYVMKIDSAGNIISGPTLVFDSSTTLAAPGPTALASIGSSLALFSFGKDGSIFRSLISKSTLGFLSNTKLGLTVTGNSTLQVTQNAGTFFLAAANPADVYRGFNLTSAGLSTGAKFRLSPRTDGGHDSGSLSADGLMAGSNDFDPTNDQFYLQPLKASGLPSGNPSISANATEITASDISNELTGGKRFLAFKNSSGQIFVQGVDSHTGAKKGSAIPLL